MIEYCLFMLMDPPLWVVGKDRNSPQGRRRPSSPFFLLEGNSLICTCFWTNIEVLFLFYTEARSPKTARLNWNQTRLASTSTTPPSTNKGTGGKTPIISSDCKCRPEEFTCSSAVSTAPGSQRNGSSRRKGQLSFTIKVFIFPYFFIFIFKRALCGLHFLIFIMTFLWRVRD